jgi:phosphatidylglycerophosphate synthase
VRAPLTAIVVAAPGPEPVVTGLTLSARAARVVTRAGVAPERVVVVRRGAELAAVAVDGGALLVVRAADQVVAPSLLAPLALAEPGARRAVTTAGDDAGALRVDGPAAAAVVAALAADPLDLAGAARIAGVEATPVVVDARARHAAATAAELTAARAWQWQLVHKPLDAFWTRRFWRPVARPLTAAALRLPLTPNMISVAGIALAVLGGFVMAAASWRLHVLGLALCGVASALDNVDGEVARLRLQSSRLGGWLDTVGDDVARLALLGGVFTHVARTHPGWPVAGVGVVAAAATALSCALLYWWCAVVGKTSNNQEYAAAIGAAPHARRRAGWGPRLADLGAAAARRDFIDVTAVVLGVLGLSAITAAGLALGGLVGAAVIVPEHLRIVRSRRAARRTAAAAAEPVHG